MFFLTSKAYEDLKSIAIYTQENWGVSQRNIYLKMMDNAFNDLSDDPNRGRKIDNIRTGYYKYKIGKHFIFYRLVSESDIEIIRILHQKMDIESHL
jgi:toxin ParE1/3/4